MHMAHTVISEIQKDLLSGNTSCRKIVEGFLKRIEEKKSLNAFLEVFTESALKKADEIDAKIKSSSPLGRLGGAVIAIKDNICYKDHKLSASSKILEGFTSLYSSTVVERLLQEDAIIIGRTNCDEFAMGSSNENSAFGNVLNPHDTTRVPGGSSGGSATAVAANLCHAALGSDTGGSIRQPASFCGVVGMKPTYGSVSRWGLIAYASSFDQIGPLTNTVEDAELILDVIAGADEYDNTCTSPRPNGHPSPAGEGKGVRSIAYLKDCIDHPGLNPEIKKRLEEIIAELKKQGHTVEPVDFPYLDYLVPAYYVLTTAEASSNLARFDGIRYGYQSKNATDLESTYRKSRSEGFGTEVKRRIMLGTFVLSSGYYDAYYSQGQKVRRVLRDKTNNILEKYDFILSPTTPGTAFKHGDVKDPIQMYLEDIFTVLANLTGLPAISLPLGKDSKSLPFGIQLMGKKFGDKEMLAFAKKLAKA